MSLALFTVLLSGMVGAAYNSEYDAAYTMKSSGQTITQKIFFKGGNKIRIEMKTKDGEARMITRLDKSVTWLLMDAQKMYMEQKFDQQTWKQYQCDQQKAKKIGSEKVLGYKCDIYETTEGNAKYTYWMIPKAFALTRSVMTENGKEKFRMEATAVHLVKQADSLFEVPAGYQKLSMKMPKM